MSKLTITEALAEIKTIEKRVQKKREFVISYLVRQEQLKDPLAKDGGSAKAIEHELQAMTDLEQRKVDIRNAIQRANAVTEISINGSNRTVADWLVWRREIAPGLQQFYKHVRNQLEAVRTEAMRKGLMTVAAEALARPGDVIVNMDEKTLVEQTEDLETVLGSLDGQLSLKNATTFVDL